MALRLTGQVDDELDGPDIRIMPEYGSALSLWDNGGELDDDRAWLQEKLGFSPELLDDLEQWSTEWRALQAADPSAPVSLADQIIARGPRARHQARGQALYERALTELRPGLTLTYRP